MTTSVSTRSAGRLNPTRQQLDELDALLQRMLDLPVHPTEEAEQAEVEETAEEPLPPVMNRAEQSASTERPRAMPPSDASVAPPQPSTRSIPPAMSSYMVIETASPRPIPAASGFEPRQPAARLVPVAPQPETPAAPLKTEEEEVPSEELPVRSEQQLSPLSSPFTPYYDPRADVPAMPEPNADEMWVPLRSTWQPSPQTWPPLAESWHQANGGTSPLAVPSTIPSPRSDPMPVSVGAASRAAPEVRLGSPDLPSTPTDEASDPPNPDLVPNSAEPRLSLSAEDAPATVPPPLLPLVWFNQGFDACLAPLGAPGRWLCGQGRSVLGFVGLACLAAAVILAVSARMAWTW